MAEQTAARPSVATGAARSGRMWRWIMRRPESSTFVVTIVLAVYFWATAPAFGTSANLHTLSIQIAATGIVALGLALVLICAEIDLSVGQTFAFAPIVMSIAIDNGLPLVPAIIVGLLAAGVVGVVNGAVTVYLRVHSFLTTLGTFFLINGLNVTLTNGFPKNTPETNIVTNSMGAGQTNYSEFIWFAVLVILFHLLLTRTRWGIHTFATGGNLNGAREAGVRIDRIKIGNFVLCAMMGGLAGILEAFRIQSIDPLSGGAAVMFLGVSAAVIGGTSLLGGSGTMIGAFFGASVLALLQDGFNLKGISAYTFDIILGIAILAAVTLNVYVTKLRTRVRPARRARERTARSQTTAPTGGGEA